MHLCMKRPSTNPSASREWGVRDAVVCSVGLIVATEVMNAGLRTFLGSDAGLQDWLRRHYHGVMLLDRTLGSVVFASVAYFCARPRTFSEYVHRTGLRDGITRTGWLLAWIAIDLGMLTLLAIERGHGTENAGLQHLSRAGGVIWAATVLETVGLAPLVEEVVMRGFIYRALRTSCSVGLSTVCVLCVDGYFHLGVLVHDPVAAASFLVGGVMLCLIREFTHRTWNCVLYHGVYNMVVLRQWWLLLAAMLCGWAYTARRGRAGNPD